MRDDGYLAGTDAMLPPHARSNRFLFTDAVVAQHLIPEIMGNLRDIFKEFKVSQIPAVLRGCMF